METSSAVLMSNELEAREMKVLNVLKLAGRVMRNGSSNRFPPS